MNVAQLRADTPGCADHIHLNNAGAGLMPLPVIEAITGHLELEARLGGYEAKDARASELSAAYAAVATLLSCRPDQVAFTENATVSYAQALSSVPFERGDVLVTTRNDYVSNQIQFLSLRDRFGIEVVRAAELPEGGFDALDLERLVRERRPRLVSVTHVPTNSGLVQDVEAAGRVCREHEVPYLLDACQTIGQLPLDFEALGCDFLSATTRKFLRGPRGCGVAGCRCSPTCAVRTGSTETASFRTATRACSRTGSSPTRSCSGRARRRATRRRSGSPRPGSASRPWRPGCGRGWPSSPARASSTSGPGAVAS